MDNLWINVAIYFSVTIVAFLFVEHGLKIHSMGKSHKQHTLGQMALRAAFAGGIVGGVVLISKFVPAYFTGIVSAFPAVLFSSMVILAVNLGNAFAQATGKIMILSASNIVIYILGVHYTFPIVGIVWGTVISFSLAFLWIAMMRPVIGRFS